MSNSPEDLDQAVQTYQRSVLPMTYGLAMRCPECDEWIDVRGTSDYRYLWAILPGLGDLTCRKGHRWMVASQDANPDGHFVTLAKSFWDPERPPSSTAEPWENEHAGELVANIVRERDRYIRLFNRLDAAVTHHMQAKADLFVDEADEALYAARAKVLSDAAQGPRSEAEVA